MLSILSNKLSHSSSQGQQTNSEMQKKRRFTVSACFVLIYGSASLFILSLVANLTTEHDYNRLPVIQQSQYQVVELAARKLFDRGTWRFRDSELKSNMINLFIEIPAPLDLSVAQTQNYITQSVCPKLGRQVWSKISGKQVKMHLVNNWLTYKVSKQGAVAARCG